MEGVFKETLMGGFGALGGNVPLRRSSSPPAHLTQAWLLEDDAEEMEHRIWPTQE